MMIPIIREDLLYYVWKTKSFDLAELRTTCNQKISIIQFGNQNFDSGPDFSNGKIKIGDTTWVGNVEMHVYSSDWERHCHDIDKAYDNVILHVVYEHDKEVYTTSEQHIPCLELKNRISRPLLKKYSQLLAANKWIPCENLLHNVEQQTKSIWLQRLAIERLEYKIKTFKSLLKSTNYSWDETLYIALASYMGVRVNKEPFERLAKSLPLLLIQKNRDDLTKIEALFFGQAGMLDASFESLYFNELKSEYAFMRKKYNLKPMSPIAWKFSRMRPVGFPTVRLAQFSQIMFSIDRLFSALILEEEIEKVRSIFRVMPSTFWNKHYRFGIASGFKEKKLGERFIDQLFINVICPIMFLYGKQMGEDPFCARALESLEGIRSEQNNIVRKYKAIGIESVTALESQALIELKKGYCDKKLCASCAIGNSLLYLKE